MPKLGKPHKSQKHNHAKHSRPMQEKGTKKKEIVRAGKKKNSKKASGYSAVKNAH